MSQRFFVPTPITSGSAALTGDEGHHLARVMRARPGDVFVLFDGTGAEFDARITQVGRNSVEFEVLERRQVDRESPVQITVGAALPKGDRQRFLVEKAVELGVFRLAPLETARGVAQPTESALERLRRAVIEASKQCGRNRLMEIAPPSPIAEFLASAPSHALRLFAHPHGEPLRAILGETAAMGSGKPDVYLAVGPEGGFTEEEVSHAKSAGWRTVRLGPRILRVETAAVALAAWFAVEGG